jgi:uncharacterized glyoxalase superfamily protein PhnB
MLKKLTPNLMVEDVRRTIDWYVDVLGFRIDATVPDEGVLNWAMLHRDDVALMFQARHSLGEEVPVLRDVPIGASQSFYIEVTGVQELYEQLRGRVEIVADMHRTFYNTDEFYFRDCNGYVLCFSEAAQPADSGA